MGLDLLDIVFRLERQFQIKIPSTELWGSKGSLPTDPTRVDFVYSYLCQKLGHNDDFSPSRRPLPFHYACLKCRMDVIGRRPMELCDCGHPIGFRPIWNGLVHALVDALDIEPGAVRPDASILRDLGAS